MKQVFSQRIFSYFLVLFSQVIGIRTCTVDAAVKLAEEDLDMHDIVALVTFLLADRTDQSLRGALRIHAHQRQLLPLMQALGAAGLVDKFAFLDILRVSY